MFTVPFTVKFHIFGTTNNTLFLKLILSALFSMKINGKYFLNAFVT